MLALIVFALVGWAKDTPAVEPSAPVSEVEPETSIAQSLESPPTGEFTPVEERLATQSIWRDEWSRWKWRGVLANSSFIPTLGNQGFGSTDIEFSIPFMRTMGSDDRALMFSPGAGVHFWNAPASYRLPETVYDFSFDVGLRWRANDRWRFILGVTPGFFTDGQAWSGEGFRIPARALAIYQWSETLSLTLGAVYLNRNDIPVVPGIGFTWTPTEYLKVDANMPRPRISYNFFEEAGGAKWWAYTGAALGGGQWLVDRDGREEVITLRQFNLVAGIERRPIPYVSMFLEGGWVFGREVEIQTPKETLIPSDSFIVRFGIGY
jgi:hypothetical protein